MPSILINLTVNRALTSKKEFVETDHCQKMSFLCLWHLFKKGGERYCALRIPKGDVVALSFQVFYIIFLENFFTKLHIWPMPFWFFTEIMPAFFMLSELIHNKHPFGLARWLSHQDLLLLLWRIFDSQHPHQAVDNSL